MSHGSLDWKPEEVAEKPLYRLTDAKKDELYFIGRLSPKKYAQDYILLFASFYEKS